jgi:hypothetical protein
MDIAGLTTPQIDRKRSLSSCVQLCRPIALAIYLG